MVTVPDRRRTAALALVSVLVVTGAMLVPVLSSHIAAARTDRVAVSATGASVIDDGDRFVVSLRIDNPTPAPIVVRESSSRSGVAVFAGDDRLGLSRGIAVSGARVPADGSATMTMTFDVAEAYRPATRETVAGAEVRGSLPVEIAGFETALNVRAAVGAD
ncbi:LEA type 2 family protein [Halobaculum magnesiiphilum]|uniref:LEA type 2 family protein n=1 Tax=Halobaculum magnesiiphilum TaxID=1017351 RepID=A0A8T8WFI6_9EURY|nr:LEA type 2 family protein [Halobaculum magnesiiphilum]QZP38591.1 LEA type 2 family protein [Halobaculum magnesiiphilum]